MFMYTTCIRINMAKLYWRIKKNEKWTWVAATEANTDTWNSSNPQDADYLQEEE